jgi:hypothetical protein
LGEKETAAGAAGSALRPGDPIPEIDVSPEGAAESRYGGAQFAGGGMSALRGAGGGAPDPEAEAAKGVAQVGLGVVGQRAVAPGGDTDPSPAEARKSDHVYQHNQTDLQ